MDIPLLFWQQQADPTFVRQCTAFFRAPGGNPPLLFPEQAAALLYLHDYRGLFGSLVVGKGKTLITFLAPAAVDAKRPVLLVPGGLVKDTHDKFEVLAKDWKRVPIEIVGYEKLSRAKNADLLKEMDPDLIVADECQMLGNIRDAACAKRVREFLALRAKEGRRVQFAALTGTPIKHSLRDFQHLLVWALPEWCPLPLRWNEFQDWADAVDEGVDPFQRVHPGALLEMADVFQVPTHLDKLTRARMAVQRRLESCPGVILTDDTLENVKLQICCKKLEPCAETQKRLTALRETWETPNGDLLTEAVDVWRHALEIVCGFVYRWDPPPPDAWLDARRQWNRFVRFTLRHNRRGLFSPAQVRNAVRRGEYPAATGYHDRWFDIRPLYDPERNKRPEWHSTWMLDYSARWLRNVSEGLVWTTHRAFGERFSEYAGVPYFSQGGLDTKKRYIERCAGESAVVSADANYKGRNLQHGWAHGLYVTFPSSAARLEQLLGRKHRTGQIRDRVTATFVIACEEQEKLFEKAIERARAIEQLGKQRQKLLYAEYVEL